MLSHPQAPISLKYQMKPPDEVLKVPLDVNSPLRRYFKRASLSWLSPIIHRWYKREFLLNLFNNTLLIRKKGKENLLYLNKFAARSLGLFKKKWCFVLEARGKEKLGKSLKEKKAKGPKKYIIGCENRQELEEWMGLLSEDQQKKISLELRSSPLLKKASSSSNTEHNDDLGPMSSQHNIGLQLSKYAHFLDVKTIDQKNAILDTLPLQLTSVFNDLVELVETSSGLFPLSLENDQWQLIFNEECHYKSFSVLLSRENKKRGRFLMTLQEKDPEEVLSLFLEQPAWDKTLLKQSVYPGKQPNESLVQEIYREDPCLAGKQQQFSYLRLENKLKDHYFLIGRSVDSEIEPVKAENVRHIEVQRLVVLAFRLVRKERPTCAVFFEIELEGEGVTPGFLATFLQKYSQFHSFVMPGPVFLKTAVGNNDGMEYGSKRGKTMEKTSEKGGKTLEKWRKTSENKEKCLENKEKCLENKDKPSENKEKPSENKLILRKKAPSIEEFPKGNAEAYAELADLERLLKYYHNGYHILDCILSRHETGLLEDCETTIETTEQQGHFAYKKDYARGKRGGLNYLNAELMSEQKRVILSLLKQAGSNLIHGRGLINVSLPVNVFEPRSFLERLARSFGHAPLFLEKAGCSDDVLEQMKLTIAFFLSSMVLCIQQEKPFNPILGETFQGRVNGCPIYLEQLSHHPPITYYYLIGRNYKLYGSHEPVANLSANTCTAEQRGSPIAHFPNNGCKICFRWPMFIINGTAMGQRSFNFYSKAIAYDKANGHLCEVLFNVSEVAGFKGLFQKKDYYIDEIGGGIYKVKPEVIDRYEAAKKPYKLDLDYQKDVIEVKAKLKGEWTSRLEFDGVKYWDIEKDRPFRLDYDPHPLPSDCNFRDDVLFLRMGKRDQAQEKKNEGEVSQRHDRKLRENYRKKAQKKN